MRLLRMLPERWQRLIPEMTKFATIGVINTAVDIAIYNALLSIGPIKASAVSMVVATTLSYVLNRYWTFAHRERSTAQQEYVLFFALNLVGFLIQTAPVAFAKYGLNFSEDGTIVDVIAFNIAKVIGIGFGMLFRFWSYRKYVFKAPKRADEPVAPETETRTTAEATATSATATASAIPAASAPAAGVPFAPRNGSAESTDDEFAELLIDEALYGGEPTRTAG